MSVSVGVVFQYGFVLQMAAFVAAACIFILNASNDLFEVVSEEIELLGGEKKVIDTPKYKGVMSKRLRRRLPRLANNVAWLFGFIFVLIALALVAKKYATWNFGDDPAVRQVIAYLAFGVDDLFAWIMIMSGIAITMLANTARQVMKVRADRLWEKTKER